MFTSIQNIICLIFSPNAADVNVKRAEEGGHGEGKMWKVKEEKDIIVFLKFRNYFIKHMDLFCQMIHQNSSNTSVFYQTYGLISIERVVHIAEKKQLCW